MQAGGSFFCLPALCISWLVRVNESDFQRLGASRKILPSSPVRGAGLSFRFDSRPKSEIALCCDLAVYMYPAVLIAETLTYSDRPPRSLMQAAALKKYSV